MTFIMQTTEFYSSDFDFREYIARYADFERSLWSYSDIVRRHKLNKREVTFVFRDSAIYEHLVSLGCRISIPFVYSIDIHGNHLITLNYDFVIPRLFEVHNLKRRVDYCPF